MILIDEFGIDLDKVPHIGRMIFVNLGYEDLRSCQAVCKRWELFLGQQRKLWVDCLETKRIQLSLKDGLSLSRSDSNDWGSNDSFVSELRDIHWQDHDDDGIEGPNDSFIYENMSGCLCCDNERKYRNAEEAKDSWFWLIEKVKIGPISDIIDLIPKLAHFYIFGNIAVPNYVFEFQQDYLFLLKLMVKYDADVNLPEFLTKAILTENTDMVKFVAPKIDIKQRFETYASMAETSGSMEIVEFLNFLHKKDSNETKDFAEMENFDD